MNSFGKYRSQPRRKKELSSGSTGSEKKQDLGTTIYCPDRARERSLTKIPRTAVVVAPLDTSHHFAAM